MPATSITLLTMPPYERRGAVLRRCDSGNHSASCATKKETSGNIPWPASPAG